MSTQRQLHIASRMEGITEVEGLINDICEEFGVEETHYGEILIAMTEAVNNAIVHGNKLDTNKMVDVQVQVEGTELQFRIADEGPGFDFENIPDWVFASFIPWLFLLVPLQYRRCKAACIPYSVIWINLGLEIVDCLAWPDSPVTPITLFTTIIDFWILLAANKMDVVRTNPNPENLFPELK